MPWLVRPIVDFFQLDLPQLSIFEFGEEASTLYWIADVLTNLSWVLENGQVLKLTD